MLPPVFGIRYLMPLRCVWIVFPRPSSCQNSKYCACDPASVQIILAGRRRRGLLDRHRQSARLLVFRQVWHLAAGTTAGASCVDNCGDSKHPAVADNISSPPLCGLDRRSFVFLATGLRRTATKIGYISRLRALRSLIDRAFLAAAVGAACSIVNANRANSLHHSATLMSSVFSLPAGTDSLSTKKPIEGQ
jgi:hypothetical protein